MEEAASGVIGDYLAQTGLFGLGLAVIAVFVWLWLKESRAVRTETQSLLSQKDRDLDRLQERIDKLREELKAAEAKYQETYEELLRCRYPSKESND